MKPTKPAKPKTPAPRPSLPSLDEIIEAMHRGWVAWERRNGPCPEFALPLDEVEGLQLDRYRAAARAIQALVARRIGARRAR